MFFGKKFTSSVVFLIFANLTPVIGILFLQWDLSNILFMYWAESGVVGFYTVLKMIFAQGSVPGARIQFLFKLSTILFFIMHFGGFMLIHGLFILVMTAGINKSGQVIPLYIFYKVFPGVLALFISHGHSFFVNFIKREERRSYSAQELMLQPYGRVIIMHMTILFGAFMVMLIGHPVGFLLVLIIVKILIDIIYHGKERQNILRVNYIPKRKYDSGKTFRLEKGLNIVLLIMEFVQLVPILAVFTGFIFIIYFGVIPNLSKPLRINSSFGIKIESTWLKYENKEIGYKLEYPDEWVVVSDWQMPEGADFKSRDNSARFTLGLIDGSLCSVYENAFGKDSFVRLGGLNMAEKSAYSWEASPEIENKTQVYQEWILLPVGGKCYSFFLYDKIGNPNKEIFDKMVSSFSLLENKSHW